MARAWVQDIGNGSKPAGLASAAGELRQQALARAGATDTAGEAGSRKSGQAGD